MDVLSAIFTISIGRHNPARMPLTTFMRKYPQGKPKNGNLSQMKNDGSGNDYIILDNFHFCRFKMKMCCVQIASRVCRIFNIKNFFSFIPDLVSSIKSVICFGVTFGYPALLCIQIISHAIATHGIFPFFFDDGENGLTQGIAFQFRNRTQHICLPVYCDKPSFKIRIFVFDIGLAFKI